MDRRVVPGRLAVALLLMVVAAPVLVGAPVPPPPDTTTAEVPVETPPAEVPPAEEPVDTTTASTTTYYEEDESYDPEEGGALVCATCAAFGVALPLVILGISIAIALWIYRDAKERNNPSAALWAILGFLFNLLGLVIYLIARKNMGSPQAPPGPTPPPPPAG